MTRHSFGKKGGHVADALTPRGYLMAENSATPGAAPLPTPAIGQQFGIHYDLGPAGGPFIFLGVAEDGKWNYSYVDRDTGETLTAKFSPRPLGTRYGNWSPAEVFIESRAFERHKDGSLPDEIVPPVVDSSGANTSSTSSSPAAINGSAGPLPAEKNPRGPA